MSAYYISEPRTSDEALYREIGRVSDRLLPREVHHRPAEHLPGALYPDPINPGWDPPARAPGDHLSMGQTGEGPVPKQHAVRRNNGQVHGAGCGIQHDPELPKGQGFRPVGTRARQTRFRPQLEALR